MALRVAVVVLASTLFSYLYLIGHTEGQAQEQLRTYVTLRSQQSAEIFRLAQDRHEILKQAFLEGVDQPGRSLAPIKLYRWSDRTQRNFPSDRPLEEFDSHHRASIILGRNVQLTQELKHRLRLFQQLVLQYGPAWQDRSTNTYLLAPENAAVAYWPEIPGALTLPGTFDVHQESFFYLSDREHNPNRQTAWTEIYNDPASPNWMISATTPIDSAEGQHLATIGQDIILTELIEQTNRDRLRGTQNLIFSADGQLIVHPQLDAKQQIQNGKLNVQDIKNAHISHIFQQVITATRQSRDKAGTTTAPIVLDDKQAQEFLGIVQLDGPSWYFVTVYPKTLLEGEATAAAQFVLLSGLLALTIEITLLYKVLQQEVAQPLGQLVSSTEQLTEADFDYQQLDSRGQTTLQQRPDEIGQLSRAFDTMAQQLQELLHHLENRIAERTNQLQTANQELERLSLVDDLTQLANRRCFDETLEEELKRQQRTQKPLSLLLCDIDYFKQYNDCYGHPTGDQCLKTVAQHIQGSTRRAADLAARYGGEEFVMILPATAMADGLAIAQQLCDRIHQAQLPHRDSPISPWVTISIGVATIEVCPKETSPSDQPNAEAIVAAADQALYKAKQSGRNRVVLDQSFACLPAIENLL